VTKSQKVPHFWSVAKRRSVAMRALRIASIVGIVLAIINHGDSLISQSYSAATIFKIALTFLVPYCVSTFSSVLAVRDQLQRLSDKTTY
jgi:uncharacterized membrane protein